MKLASGTKLRSQVCTTEVIVLRGGDVEGELTCGGVPMSESESAGAPASAPAVGLDTGSALGKRYTDASGAFEVLVTKAGAGTLGLGQEPLLAKAAKPLPSSD